MERIERPKNKETNPLNIFETLIGIHLVEVEYDAVPEEVRKHFESQSSKFVPQKEYQTKNFKKILSFTFPNGDSGYLAEQDKTYKNGGDTERLTYFMDTREGEETGYLELRCNLSNSSVYFVGKPFVGFTRTKDGFENEGLGERRLKIANAYAIANYGAPLNSDTIIEDTAKRIWERLVEHGEAEKFKEGKHDRFRFLYSK